MKALKIEGKDSQLQVNTETIIDSASRVKGGNVAAAATAGSLDQLCCLCMQACRGSAWVMRDNLRFCAVVSGGAL